MKGKVPVLLSSVNRSHETIRRKSASSISSSYPTVPTPYTQLTSAVISRVWSPKHRHHHSQTLVTLSGSLDFETALWRTDSGHQRAADVAFCRHLPLKIAQSQPIPGSAGQNLDLNRTAMLFGVCARVQYHCTSYQCDCALVFLSCRFCTTGTQRASGNATPGFLTQSHHPKHTSTPTPLLLQRGGPGERQTIAFCVERLVSLFFLSQLSSIAYLPSVMTGSLPLSSLLPSHLESDHGKTCASTA